ncbi:hypothetical protein SDC9_204108 [bioreactor metagenome]|uniref:Uncharacterized protein n=1 Tax=bioreactor metagenome TaxID=1076179 RepID=A0A645IZT4_9ZZZZ
MAAQRGRKCAKAAAPRLQVIHKCGGAPVQPLFDHMVTGAKQLFQRAGPPHVARVTVPVTGDIPIDIRIAEA